jgi:tRNA(Ile)-lysidine synthase
MINEFKLHIAELVPNLTQKTYLLAVSGGVDSVVMTHLFKELGLNFELAHCNFQLRDLESDADERFVSALSKTMQIPFHHISFETDSFAKSHGMSIQMAARTLRYQWFQNLASNHYFDFIVTAHHKNDLAETMLLNLTKGTGHTGLVGIKAVQQNLLRPMLIFAKDEILKFAKSSDLNWREDASNTQDKYQRNYLRINVLPLLKELNPKAEDAFFRTSEKMHASNAFIKNQIDVAVSKYCEDTRFGLEISYKIFEYQNDTAFVLSEILRPYGFDYYKCIQIASHDRQLVGISFFSESHHLVLDRYKYVLTELTPNVEELLLEGIPERFEYGKYHFHSKVVIVGADVKLSKDEFLLPINFKNKQIKLRYLKDGDNMAPYGMKGRRKKVADLLNEAKVPLNIKNYIPIFQADKEIIYVAGIRSSEICKVKTGDEAIIIRII